MPLTRVELTAMDKRICPICSGAGWYYADAPGRKPIPYVLKPCPRTILHQNYAFESVEAEAIPA